MRAAPTFFASLSALHLVGCMDVQTAMDARVLRIDARSPTEARALREMSAACASLPEDIVGEWDAEDKDNTRLVLCSDGRSALFTFGPHQHQDCGLPAAAKYDQSQRLLTVQVFESPTLPPAILHFRYEVDASLAGLDALLKGMRFSKTAVVISEQYKNAFGSEYPIR